MSWTMWGNQLADALAGRAAEGARISLADEKRIDEATGMGFLVALRLLAINDLVVKAVDGRGQLPRASEAGPTQLQRLLAASGHDLGAVARLVKGMPASLRCTRCTQGTSKTTLKAWLKRAPCPGPLRALQPGLCAPLPGPPPALRVGRADLHRSHVLLHRSGLWWCVACGAYTTVGSRSGKSSPKMLRKECTKHTTKATAYYLRRIAKGHFPKKNQDWPHEAEEVLLTTRYRASTKTRVHLDQLSPEANGQLALGMVGLDHLDDEEASCFEEDADDLDDRALLAEGPAAGR